MWSESPPPHGLRSSFTGCRTRNRTCRIAMHRAVGMRWLRKPLDVPRRRLQHVGVSYLKPENQACATAATILRTSSQPLFPQTMPQLAPLVVPRRFISSTGPTLKRRGGASALLPKSSRPKSKSKRGGKKKMVRRHGEPGQKAKDKAKTEEERKKVMARLAAITPEESAK